MPETAEEVPRAEEQEIQEIPSPVMIILEGAEDAPVCENGVCL
ncbi:hypothetical protein [Actinoplanes couchii]|uniref:Uncharacterized protein n=1 Tax=Actinoplanes couchii TaxID=403638 RepID=A0ABQ3XN00_9ACTN|nr:hypothetical protein [Actinoplanes couchii]MDR6317903.1 hypothetical protein [Actinoplanes couchii]GID59890.1 hypothetical protein Aco03nite_082940 [Actinoplanes couchii]